MTALSPRPRRIRQDRPPSAKQLLPAAPLADAVLRLAVRKGGRKAVCERAGIPERVVARWHTGESGGNVELGLADQVMTRLDLFWWEIWTEETVREPLFMVTTYHTCMKKDASSIPKRRRVKDRTIPYGDLGTDFWRLREIRELMSGGLEEAA